MNFWDKAPSRTSVYRWCAEFNRGPSSLQEEFREGHPKSVVVPETIIAVRQLILQDRHVTYREIEITLGINGTNIHSRSTKHFQVIDRLFFGKTGHVANLPLGQRRTVNSEWYIPMEIPQSEWRKCFDNWLKRMQKCVDLNGEYFEKQ